MMGTSHAAISRSKRGRACLGPSNQPECRTACCEATANHLPACVYPSYAAAPTRASERVAEAIPEGKVVDFLTGKHVNDTPEEYVRQNTEKALVLQYRFPKGDCQPEFLIKIGSGPTKRVDIIGSRCERVSDYVPRALYPVARLPRSGPPIRCALPLDRARDVLYVGAVDVQGVDIGIARLAHPGVLLIHDLLAVG
jgi:hypothetical protein